MTSQGQLAFDAPVAPPTEPESNRGERDVVARFAAFHEANPQVYRALRDLAVSAVRRGATRGSMKRLFEVLRWETSVQTRGDPWLLNNTYTAHYARLLMAREPALAGFFETRCAKADGEAVA